MKMDFRSPLSVSLFWPEERVFPLVPYANFRNTLRLVILHSLFMKLARKKLPFLFLFISGKFVL